MSKHLTLCLYILSLIVIGQFAIEMYLPSMPAMASYFNVKMNLIESSVTFYVFGACIGALLCGGLSDMWGRRPMVVVCLAISIVGGLFCSIATNIIWLLIGRFIQGVGLAGVGVLARSITKDVSNDQIGMAKLASILGVGYAGAVSCAPIIGGYIQQYSFWRMNFIVLFMVSLILGVLAWFTLPETNKYREKMSVRQLIGDHIEVLSNRKFLLYNTMSLFALGGAVAYYTAASNLLQVKVGLSPTEFGYTAAALTLSIIVGAFFNSLAVERRGVNKMMLIGFWLLIFAGVIYIVTGVLAIINLVAILFPAVLFTIGVSIIFPNASSSSISLFEKKAGVASSVYNSLQLIGATASSGIVSLIGAQNQWLLGVLYLVFGVIGLKLVKLSKVL